MVETCIDVMAITQVYCYETSKILKISLPFEQTCLNYVYLVQTDPSYIATKFGVIPAISFGGNANVN